MSEVYKGKKFGVKRIKNYFAVEETDVLGDISKYDFVLKDRCTDSYNGNVSYAASVMTELCDEPIYNGWRIKRLNFPGCWWGQEGTFTLIDKYGKECNSLAFGCRKWYTHMQEEFISECLIEALKFAQNNHSVMYVNIIKGFSIPCWKVSINEYHDPINKINEYINDYRELRTLLDDENASNELLQPLDDAFHSQIKKCFPFDIVLSK